MNKLLRDLLGRPIHSREIGKTEIGSIEGLPALSLDALTSVAYGPEAIVVVIAAGGAGALHLVLPITIGIVVLLAILVVSYCQVIGGYPEGGGAYAVSRANLGSGLSRLAAASLIVDYTLTVAVSIAAGVGALTSAFQQLQHLTLPLCLAILLLITIVNLRGVGEAARAFLLPTAVFVVGLLAVITVGLIHPLALHLIQPGKSTLPAKGLESVGLLLVLKAFASGCSALTGVEAIANGVPLFRKPRQRTARRTEVLLGTILGVMLLGLAVLAVRFHVGPRSDNTVLSQIMGYAVGRSWAYFVVSIAITLVLALAANTSFGGLPVLSSLLARDHYAPHSFALRGERLVFSQGVIVLAVLSAALLAAVGGNTDTLIPLFAIGVFIGFTLAQSGMVVHWWRLRPAGWRRRAAINALGASATGTSTVVFLVTKFLAGGWVVAAAVPLIMLGFWRINCYYVRVGEVLQLDRIPPVPHGEPTLVIVPVTGVSRASAQAIEDALSYSSDVVAVNVELPEDKERCERLHQAWDEWDPGVPLVILRSDYHSVVNPTLRYVRKRKKDHKRILVLIPVVQPRRWRFRLLHNHLDLALSASLAKEPDVIVARSPVRIDVGPAR